MNHHAHNRFRRTLTRRNGQAFVEYFSIIGIVLAALVGAVVAFGDGIMNLFTGAGEQTLPITEQMVDMTPEQELPPRVRRYGAVTGPATGGTMRPGLGGIIGSGSGSGSGGGGGGGGGSVPGGGGGGGGTAGGGGPIPTVPSGQPEIEIAPGLFAQLPTNGERDLILAAINTLLRLNTTVDLMNLTTGAMDTHRIANIAADVIRNGVRIMVGDALSLGAAAYVLNFYDEAFSVITAPVYLVLDRTLLATQTTEVMASIFIHEAWHVHQVFNGIMDDFFRYPRVVDIEYEAFVVESAAWEAIKGDQDLLDSASECVAAGEAMCKEILATDFGYSTGPRFEETFGQS